MHGVPFEAVAATAVLVCAGAFEMVRPWRPAGDATTRRWIANLTLYVISFGLAYVMAPIVAALVAMAHVHLALMDRIQGTALRIAVAVLCLDLLDYTLHRVSHRVGVLWRVHQTHHSDVELDITTALRHHPFETVITSLVIGGGGALLGFSTMEIAFYGGVAIAVQLVAHANLVLPSWLANGLAPVLVTPDFHRLHHTRSRPDADANYGQVFSFWDRIFGTRRSGDVEAVAFGLDTMPGPEYQRLSRLLAQPMLRQPQP